MQVRLFHNHFQLLRTHYYICQNYIMELTESNIKVSVQLDDKKVPQTIFWDATDSTAEQRQEAKAMMLSFWDGQDKSAMRIDLWTKEMMVDEMADFYYQTFMGMADTFGRSTGQQALVADMKAFAADFLNKFNIAIQQ